MSNSLKHLTISLAFCLCLSCSSSQQLSKVDEEVYGILKKAENEVYGKNSKFTISTQNPQKPIASITGDSLKKISARSGSVELSLSEALHYAVKNSDSYQSQKESLYLAGLNMSDSQIPFDWGTRSSADISRDRSSNGTQSLSLGADQSVNKLFAAGGSIGIRLANDLVKFFTGNTNRSISSVVSFNLTQPLLRGRGAEIAAESLTQSYRNVIYQMRTYDSFQQNFHREIVIDYLDILQQQRQLENEVNNLKSRQKNFEYLKARSIDRERPSEVAEAEQDVLQAEIRVVNAQTNYASILDSFKVTIGMPAGIALHLKKEELERVANVGLLPFVHSQQSAYQKALLHRGSLLNEVDRFEDSRREVLIAADDLKTQLDFVANASLPNSGNRWERLNFDDLNAGIGLELDLPINRERERNSYKRSLIRFHAAARSLRQSHDELKNTIRLRLRQLSQFRKNYEIQLGALKLAENRVEGDQLRLKAGNLIFRRLSESQDALIQAKNSVTVALVNYQESRLRIMEELGVLDIEKTEFWLKP